MIQAFRIIGLIEGVTTLGLFLVAMPLKYWFAQPHLVQPLGMLHGMAFLGYLAGMWVLLRSERFSLMEWGRTAAAAFFPFGTFLNDAFLRRKRAERLAAE
jgi:integral membrane protein